jgi:hypothetical protein
MRRVDGLFECNLQSIHVPFISPKNIRNGAKGAITLEKE